MGCPSGPRLGSWPFTSLVSPTHHPRLIAPTVSFAPNCLPLNTILRSRLPRSPTAEYRRAPSRCVGPAAISATCRSSRVRLLQITRQTCPHRRSARGVCAFRVANSSRRRTLSSLPLKRKKNENRRHHRPRDWPGARSRWSAVEDR